MIDGSAREPSAFADCSPPAASSQAVADPVHQPSTINHQPGPRLRRVAVIGAGITGLSAAHRLLELARERSLEIDVLVLEGGGRAGGVIATERRDGFLLEGGPESFITDKPWGVALCERLGGADQLIGTNETHRPSFIAWRGRLLPIPEGFQVLAPS